MTEHHWCIIEEVLGTLYYTIDHGNLWAWTYVWGCGRTMHAKFWPWKMLWDVLYDQVLVFCRTSFS